MSYTAAYVAQHWGGTGQAQQAASPRPRLSVIAPVSTTVSTTREPLSYTAAYGNQVASSWEARASERIGHHWSVVGPSKGEVPLGRPSLLAPFAAARASQARQVPARGAMGRAAKIAVAAVARFGPSAARAARTVAPAIVNKAISGKVLREGWWVLGP